MHLIIAFPLQAGLARHIKTRNSRNDNNTNTVPTLISKNPPCCSKNIHNPMLSASTERFAVQKWTAASLVPDTADRYGRRAEQRQRHPAHQVDVGVHLAQVRLPGKYHPGAHQRTPDAVQDGLR